MKQKIDPSRLIGELKRQYPDRCSVTAPFAYWKMKALMEDGDAYAFPEYDCRYLIRRGHLLYYDSPDDLCHIPAEELNALEAISLPASVFEGIKDSLTGFTVHEYWGLRYDFSAEPPPADTRRYEAAPFRFQDEGDYALAAQIISGGEGGSPAWMTAEKVRRMAAFPAFDPTLWFFMCDRASQSRVAVSISAYSPEVKETDLDWIYVLPAFQGKGVGRYLLYETVRRCAGKSDVIRVGGTVEFYRKCGFVNDAQWVWAVKPGYRLVCESIQP